MDLIDAIKVEWFWLEMPFLGQEREKQIFSTDKINEIS
jgi:hypothetical protein